MLDIAQELEAALAAGHRLGVVVVMRVYGSAPRQVGSAMAVTDDGRVIGAISGGCVESEAYELARSALASGVEPVATLGLSDGDAMLAGLSCGGHLDVVAVTLGPADDAVRGQLVLASQGRVAGIDVDVAAGRVTAAADTGGQTALAAGTLRLRRDDAPRLIIVGAVDFSAALATAARPLGYRITVVDARPVFATAERHRDAHEVIRAWPGDYLAGTCIGPRDVICVLTHEERFDIPALVAALDSPAAYVGAMGSRRTDARRRELLREAGLTAEALARLHSPIGLDLGGRSATETAVSIVAEIIAEARGGSGRALSDRDGAIHVRSR